MVRVEKPPRKTRNFTYAGFVPGPFERTPTLGISSTKGPVSWRSAVGSGREDFPDEIAPSVPPKGISPIFAFCSLPRQK